MSYARSPCDVMSRPSRSCSSVTRNPSTALTTGIFNAPSLGGPGSVQDWVKGTVGYPGIWAQFLIQLKAVSLVIVWTAVVAAVGFLIVKLVMGLRVSEEEEREGLDISSHGERAYDM